MPMKTCPSCGEKCGPRSHSCPKCQHQFGTAVRATVPQEKAAKVSVYSYGRQRVCVPGVGMTKNVPVCPVKPANYERDGIRDWMEELQAAVIETNRWYTEEAFRYVASHHLLPRYPAERTCVGESPEWRALMAHIKDCYTDLFGEEEGGLSAAIQERQQQKKDLDSLREFTQVRERVEEPVNEDLDLDDVFDDFGIKPGTVPAQ